MENLAINTMADVRSFFFYLMEETRIGASFHPDTPMPDYTDRHGNPVFGREGCEAMQTKIERCFDVCEESGHDIYETGLALGRKLGYYPRPDDQKVKLTVLFGEKSIREFEELDSALPLEERLDKAVEEGGDTWDAWEFDTEAEKQAFMQGLFEYENRAGHDTGNYYTID